MTGQPYAVPVPKGYRVGSWEVRERLASGAFATVYAGRLVGDDGPDLPRQAALKFLPTGTRTPRQLHHLRELAEREVELLGKLRAPRLIRMYDTLTIDDPGHPELDGATVLVLERAEGSLDAALEHEPKPEAGPVLLAQICEGLHQLHHAGWVHGDLKPANVLLLEDGSVRLADFNMAAEMEGTHAYSPAFATRDYTAPELLWPEIDERGTRIRPTADIWAFGVLAHVVLTGTFPLPGSTTEARTDAVMRYARGAEELRLHPELPEAWRDIVRDCLARTHAERITGKELLRRAEQAADVPRSPRLRRRFRHRHRHPVLAAALATVLLATTGTLGTAYLYVNQDDGTPVYQALSAESAFPTGPNGKVIYGYDRCPRDRVCFFSEHNGTGYMCSWQGDDANWQSGEETCAWAASQPVRSVFNNIVSSRKQHDLVYYRGTDFEPAGHDRSRQAQRTGCSAVNSMGNLAGTYAPLSHELVGSCSTKSALWTILSLFD
ncbi:protein kinase [Streptomyces sp. NBC_00038]|uniref:protein kinase domain-containing protein n=1 Tax=Streptomyces sp. NBC_00038 TaxID=2903615 RepID=UPI0022500E3D|nr:protein kinase [Streptomyces sp. NBC_00038]MCX5562030.1 serine/threonine-protein kinase [Streptomyces sp. NBC_00038]